MLNALRVSSYFSRGSFAKRMTERVSADTIHLISPERLRLDLLTSEPVHDADPGSKIYGTDLTCPGVAPIRPIRS
jgi:hypothetical protein